VPQREFRVSGVKINLLYLGIRAPDHLARSLITTPTRVPKLTVLSLALFFT
jgi:hypothetical protein